LTLRMQMRLPSSDTSGVPNFARSMPQITAEKIAFGAGVPRCWLPEIQQGRLPLHIGLVFGGRHHSARRRSFSDVARRLLRAQGHPELLAA